MIEQMPQEIECKAATSMFIVANVIRACHDFKMVCVV